MCSCYGGCYGGCYGWLLWVVAMGGCYVWWSKVMSKLPYKREQEKRFVGQEAVVAAVVLALPGKVKDVDSDVILRLERDPGPADVIWSHGNIGIASIRRNGMGKSMTLDACGAASRAWEIRKYAPPTTTTTTTTATNLNDPNKK